MKGVIVMGLNYKEEALSAPSGYMIHGVYGHESSS